MVNAAVRAYMEVQATCRLLDLAAARVQKAYALYQQVLADVGPYPQHGWQRQKLEARRDAVLASIEEYRVAVGAALGDLALIELKPPF